VQPLLVLEDVHQGGEGPPLGPLAPGHRHRLGQPLLQLLDLL